MYSTPCAGCYGKGKVSRMDGVYPNAKIVTTTCTECNGTGRIPDNR